ASREAGEEEDATFPEYEGTYFSGTIKYLDLFEETQTDEDTLYLGEAVDSNPPFGYSSDNYRVSTELTDSEVRSFYEEQNPKAQSIQVLKTEKGYYVMTSYREPFFTTDDYLYSIMYINIMPLIQYIHSLNLMISGVFLLVALCMSFIGWKLGRRVEKEQEEKQHFFQNSSHELKTPLTAIQGYAEGILTGVTDTTDGANVILDESDRMTLLVDEILTISKLDAHVTKLDCNDCDLREILYDSMEAVEPIQKEHGIQITPLFPDTPVHIYCDENQMTRVFKNILLNGISHGKQNVVVTCKSDEKNAFVQIRDDGNGILEEDLPYIFDRFYTGKNGNTGIGLALAKEIVKLHKGNITARNDIGAVFEVTLPCRGKQKKEKDQTQTRHPKLRAPKLRAQKRK
ncbi:MAG TPA: HAMP domain-containing sensor histidine kinase, partial [Clostridiales bacterium]|nr:HAMP domain-containing sensor histidine kinase [Clostridiales bacterium]